MPDSIHEQVKKILADAKYEGQKTIILEKMVNIVEQAEDYVALFSMLLRLVHGNEPDQGLTWSETMALILATASIAATSAEMAKQADPKDPTRDLGYQIIEATIKLVEVHFAAQERREKGEDPGPNPNPHAQHLPAGSPLAYRIHALQEAITKGATEYANNLKK